MVIRQPQRLRDSDDWSEYNGVPMPVEEFLHIDNTEESDLEYFDGAAWVKGLVDRKHRVLIGTFDFHFGLYQREHGGEYGPEGRVRLAPNVYRKPDTAYYVAGTDASNDSLPTVAVEVRSPDETMASQRRKCRMFREHGVPVCWLVDPVSRTVEVFEEGRDGERLPSDGVLETALLPGFWLRLEELFGALDR